MSDRDVGVVGSGGGRAVNEAEREKVARLLKQNDRYIVVDDKGHVRPVVLDSPSLRALASYKRMSGDA